MCEVGGRGNEIEIKSINNSKFVEEADRTVVITFFNSFHGLTLYSLFIYMLSPHNKGNSVRAAHFFHHPYISGSHHCYMLNTCLSNK